MRNFKLPLGKVTIDESVDNGVGVWVEHESGSSVVLEASEEGASLSLQANRDNKIPEVSIVATKQGHVVINLRGDDDTVVHSFNLLECLQKLSQLQVTLTELSTKPSNNCATYRG